jgi:hypothetical protein
MARAAIGQGWYYPLQRLKVVPMNIESQKWIGEE